MNIEPEAAAAAGERRLNHIFFFSLNCSLLMQVFPPKVELVFSLAVPLIFVQPTGELTKQLGGWCFGPTGCKSQGQSQRCISWSLDPDVTPSWHLCPQQDKRTGEVAHDTLQKIIETPSTSLHLKDISSLLSPSGDLGIGLVWDNPTPPRLFGPTVEILFKLNYLWWALSCS